MNVLSSLVRTGRVSKKDALALWWKVLTLFRNKQKEVDYDEVLSISVEKKISAYDAACLKVSSGKWDWKTDRCYLRY